MAVFVRWVFAVWKLVGTVGKQSVQCFVFTCQPRVPSDTAQQLKCIRKHILLLLAPNCSSNLANGPDIPILLHFKRPGVPSFACLVHCQKEELLALCRIHSVWPHGVWYHPFNHHDAIYLPFFSDQTEKEDFFILHIFFLSVCPTDNCQ